LSGGSRPGAIIEADVMRKKPGIVKRFIYLAEYVSLRLFGAVLAVLPGGFAYASARFLGWAAFDILRIRRDVTLSNLRAAMGDELSESEIESLARESYCNIGMTFVEMLLMRGRKERLLERIDVSALEKIRRHLDGGSGVIVVSCHFGSWELNGASIAMSGMPFTVVAKRQKNPYVNDFINKRRRNFGMRVTVPGETVKDMVKALRRGEAVGLVSDQDAGKSGVFVEFFGRRASTPTGAAQLALKYGAPIVVSLTVRVAPGRYATVVEDVEVRGGDDVESLTQRFTSVMEGIIRKHPEQYFWMHRRWKTRGAAGVGVPGERVPAVSAAGE